MKLLNLKRERERER